MNTYRINELRQKVVLKIALEQRDIDDIQACLWALHDKMIAEGEAWEASLVTTKPTAPSTPTIIDIVVNDEMINAAYDHEREDGWCGHAVGVESLKAIYRRMRQLEPTVSRSSKDNT